MRAPRTLVLHLDTLGYFEALELAADKHDAPQICSLMPSSVLAPRTSLAGVLSALANYGVGCAFAWATSDDVKMHDSSSNLI